MSESDQLTVPRTHSANADAKWKNVDALLAQLEELQQTTEDSRDFHARVLSRVVAGMAASSGTFWTRSGNELECIATVSSTPETPRSESLGLSQLVAEVANSGLPLRHQVDEQDILFIHPIQSLAVGGSSECLGVLELSVCVIRDQAELPAVLSAVCDIVAEHYERASVRRLHESSVQAHAIEQFVSELYSSCDMRTTTFALANAGRDFLKCDRLTVLIRETKGYRVRAVSGVDTINPRAQAIRKIELLVDQVACTSEDFVYDRNVEDLPPQLAPLVSEVVEANHCSGFAILPISSEAPPQIDAALFVEHFTNNNEVPPNRLSLVRKHAGKAIQQSTQVEQVPFWSVWQRLQLKRSLYRLGSHSVSVAAAILVLVAILFVPVEFDVTASATLEPAMRRNVYAPVAGEVIEMFVDHGSAVLGGQPLLRITAPSIEQSSQELQGAIKATRERLAAIRVTRLEGRSHIDSDRMNRLSAEHTALETELTSLMSRYDLISAQQAALTLRSPFDGVVTTWDVQGRLNHRPVKPGDKLLTVADTSGDWNLRVKIPSDHASYVASWRQQNGTDNEITFHLESTPSIPVQGRLVGMASVTAVDRDENSYVPATAAIEQTQLPATVRSGAPARVHIHCGRRALAFVWFHELIEMARSHLLF